MTRLLRLFLIALICLGVLAPAATAPPAAAVSLPYWYASRAVTRIELPYSWRAGCPVPVSQLVYAQIRHWGFDGRPRIGELVVSRAELTRVLRAFGRLYAIGYRIQQMRRVDVYRGDDNASMAANNTSAFNCRPVAGRPGVWSQHAYGSAIDINPVQNPYVSSTGAVSPPAGLAYADRRTRRHVAMILAGDRSVAAFTAQGWGWGGTWLRSKDYQHFSRSGR